MTLDQNIIKQVSASIGATTKQVTAVLDLLNEGNTIPFIARYRKEITGGLDETEIAKISKEWEYANSLLERKEDVIRLIDEKGLLTPELEEQILEATKLVEVEDLYRPFKEKKKTKATEAIKLGLEPLAKYIYAFSNGDPLEEAKKYLTAEVLNVEEAITNALYIIAEIISDNPEHRKQLRFLTTKNGVIETSLKKDGEKIDENKVYDKYYDASETISKIKSHRILAINRAEKEKVINAKINIDNAVLLDYLYKKELKDKNSMCCPYVEIAIKDSLKRLIFPSIEREIRASLTETAEDGAILVFSNNLEKLLLQPPLKGKRILGVDPAFRTGCKLCVVNEVGTVLEIGVIYPHEKKIGASVNSDAVLKSMRVVAELIKKYNIEIIAIGNGTASRETEKFIADLIQSAKLNVKYVIVSEAGASVYSASKLAIEEFPDLSVEQRSAASIARRLQDPLSELVKIDPKAIGVGQYQHDVSPKKLESSLNEVVVNAVNSVGVDINIASKALLTYVSGLNKKSAEALVKYRDKNNRYNDRKELLNVPGLGPKAYEQAVGFLRITDGNNLLDITAVHPESYSIANEIMKLYSINKDQFGKPELKDLFKNVNIDDLAQKVNSDKYTVKDIVDALIAPLRDPRDEFPQPILKNNILSIDDLSEGMELQGTVRNVTDFGAFIDIGLKNDGMVHISKISKVFIKHPSDILKVGDIVTVYIFEIDKIKGKVALTMLK